jgi:hypothetical protein
MYIVDEAELSRLLFGRAGRLRLARWILETVPAGAYFFAGEAQLATEAVPNEIKENINRLVELGVITKAHRDPGPGRRQHYQRVESPVWGIFELAVRLAGDGSSTVDAESRTQRPIGPDSQKLRRRGPA